MEEKIDQLIEDLQSITMTKSYLTKLASRLDLERRKTISIRHRIQQIERRLKKGHNKIRAIFFTSYRKKIQNHFLLLREHYQQLTLYLEEKEQFIELLSFDQSVLLEKTSAEKELREELRELLLKRSQELKALNSPHLNQLIELTHELDKYKSLHKEVQEIIVVGEKAFELADRIVVNLKHKLYRQHNSMRHEFKHEPGFPLKRISVQKELKEQGRVLTKQLFLYEDELDRLYTETKVNTFYLKPIDYLSIFTPGKSTTRILARGKTKNLEIQVKTLKTGTKALLDNLNENQSLIQFKINQIKQQKLDWINTAD